MTAAAEPEEGIPEGALREFFGDRWEAIHAFHGLLAEHGEPRGLIGPRERGRLWRRHVLNSAALVDFLPDHGVVLDIGSGAGLPGVVLALMRPDLEFHLVEPMQRRAGWLAEVAALVAAQNVRVHQARAEGVRLQADAVTARAVAPLGTLVGWAAPLVSDGGRVVVLKGRRAPEEVAAARSTLNRLGFTHVALHEVDVLALGEPTTVVTMTRA